MRIAYLNPSGKLGGAETSLRELLASVRAAEPNWDLWLVLGEDGPLAGIARDLGVRVSVMPFPRALARLGDNRHWSTLLSLLEASLATVAYARKLRRLLAEIDADVVHSNGFKMHLLGVFTRPRRAALVWHVHDYVSSRRLMPRLLRPFRNKCSAAIVNSKSVARDMDRALPGLRIVPIYNALDLQRFAPEGGRLDLDAKSGLTPAPPGTVRIGLIATFAKWKGHKVFLEALALLPDGARIRGYIIGGPIYQTEGSQWSERELQQEVERLGLSGKLGFTGFLEDVPAALRSVDIVVHASTQPEPFGMVIIEGMACGKAVIASQAGGAAELISDGKNALAHSPGDAVALANQMERLASDAALRDSLGRAGRLVAEEKYNGGRLAAQVLAVYRDLSGQPSSLKPNTAFEDAPSDLNRVGCSPHA